MVPSSARGGLHENDAAFLQRFAAREAENRAAKQKATLSVEQHAAHRAQMSNVRFIKPQYADETQINVSGIFNKWRRYAKLSYAPFNPHLHSRDSLYSDSIYTGTVSI